MKNIFYNAIKSFDLEEYPDEAWTWLMGGPTRDEQTQLLSKVDWLYRAVELVMISIADIPFYIFNKRGDEIDSSADWQNKIGYWPDPVKTIQLVGGGLFCYGYAYLLREKGGGVLNKDLRYLMPGSVTPHIDGAKGLDYFERAMPDGSKRRFKPADEIVYFWLNDPSVEIGPPKAWPAQAAYSAAGVLYNLDAFTAQYFGRGAVKATLLSIPPNTKEAEAQKVKDWWRQFVTGIKNAFASNILSTEVKATIIGEGLEALTDKNLVDQSRQAIATAAGIPQSLLAANAANYATSQQDKKNLYDNMLNPWANMIARILTDQVFKEDGYRLEFHPEEMEIYQEDENLRAQAYKTYVDGGIKPSIAAEMLGLDLPEGVEYEDLDPEEKPEMLELPEMPEEETEPEESTPASPQEGPGQAENEKRLSDMDKWERKALKALKRAGSAVVSFESDYISSTEWHRINTALAEARTDADVRVIFDDGDHDGRPDAKSIVELTEALRSVALAMREKDE